MISTKSVLLGRKLYISRLRPTFLCMTSVEYEVEFVHVRTIAWGLLQFTFFVYVTLFKLEDISEISK